MLDAESEALLAARRRAGIPPVSSQTVEAVRAQRAAWRAANSVPLRPVHAMRDVAGPVPLRLYWPGAQANLPVIVFCHGGGWVLGDLEQSDVLCGWLAMEAGALVVNVDYRLAPEHKYPTAAEDAFAVLRWLVEAAPEFGGDPKRLAVAGSSAGGNLAAVTTLMARDRGGPQLAAQLLVYPVTDYACDAPSFTEFADGYVVSAEDMRWYWRQYLVRPEQAAEPYASPLRAPDLAGLPPALVITAECDPVRDDGERYAERLRVAGVPVRLSRYPGTLHGFFAMPGANARGTQAVREAALFLARAFDQGRPS